MTPGPPYLLGLIGSGIQASRTPTMHEREGARHGFRTLYKLIDLDRIDAGIEELPELLRNAQRFGFNGLNITHPCKQAVIPLLDGLSEEAREIGAVNTVVFSQGRSFGHNTDWWGFAESMKLGLSGADLSSVLQLGTGGAGSATAYALLKLGAERVALYDPDTAKAIGLADQLNSLFGARATAVSDPVAAAAQASGLVQATPIGMKAHPGLPITADALRPELWVSEVIYFPLETELLRAAREKGCRTVDGSGMAVFQAVRAFELFTGRAPDAGAMRADLFNL
jgi:shikimate dehydrogenase